jgi:tRNA-dihydrouridine synthase
MKVGTVGGIENASLANDLLEKDGLDIVTVGRGFQKNPGLGEWIPCKIKWICDADSFSLRVGRRVGPQSTYAEPDRMGFRREEPKGRYKVLESAH